MRSLYRSMPLISGIHQSSPGLCVYGVSDGRVDMFNFLRCIRAAEEDADGKRR